MSDFENAGYRLLSFRYTPPKPINQDEPRGPEGTDKSSLKAGAELPSLAPLMTALPDVQEEMKPTQQHQDDKAASGPDEDKDNRPAESSSSSSPSTLQEEPQFHPFCNLPTELRIKIWELTFLTRVVELHPTRPNYSAVHDDPSRQPLWQSGCSNPAALSACTESRDLALNHFRIAFPLAAITADQVAPAPFSRHAGDTSTYNFSGISVNGKARLLRRVMHMSPDHDTVALLGQDSDFMKLSQLMRAFKDADPLGIGIGRLALSVRGWGYGGSVTMMKSLGRTILKDLEQLTLFMYGERSPPPDWRLKGASLSGEVLDDFRRTGNRCELIPCEGSSAWDAYRVWSGGRGRQFWDSDGKILRVGRNEMQVMDLEFKDGW